MSKYEQFQQLFVDNGQSHKTDADDCFDAIADLTQQMIADSDWYSNDVEFISLNPSIALQKPHQILRFKRSGRNRERIREVAIWTGSFWSLGIRFRLRPQVNESFQPREIMFVLPILVKKKSNGNLIVKLDSDGTAYEPNEFERLTELVFQQIQKSLEQGIQHLIGRNSQFEELQDLGYVIRSESLQSLTVEIEKTAEYESSQLVSEPMIEVGEEAVEIAVEPISESVEEFTVQPAEPIAELVVEPIQPVEAVEAAEPDVQPIAESAVEPLEAVVQPTVEAPVEPSKKTARSRAKAAKQPTVAAARTTRSRTNR
jgi:hypothetical protein